jgi:ABC-2 type transport system permease protein
MRVARLLDSVRLYRRLVGASIRGQMQYRVSFVIRTVIDFGVIVSDFVPVYLLVYRFGDLQGWTFAELALLYGMVSVSWGIVEGALRGFEGFGPYLVQGDLDRWLLRPRSVLLQVASHQFEIRKLGRILQGLVVLCIAIWVLNLAGAALGWILLGIFGGIGFFSGIVILGAATQFWTLGHTAELQNMLTYGGSAALTYPVSVYSRWFRRVLTYGVPLAFVNYFPALAALGRTGSAGWPPFVPWISPLACMGVLLVSVLVFKIGLQRYESTGT